MPHFQHARLWHNIDTVVEEECRLRSGGIVITRCTHGCCELGLWVKLLIFFGYWWAVN